MVIGHCFPVHSISSDNMSPKTPKDIAIDVCPAWTPCLLACWQGILGKLRGFDQAQHTSSALVETKLGKKHCLFCCEKHLGSLDLGNPVTRTAKDEKLGKQINTEQAKDSSTSIECQGSLGKSGAMLKHQNPMYQYLSSSTSKRMCFPLCIVFWELQEPVGGAAFG